MQQLLCIDCKYFKILTEPQANSNYTRVGCTCIRYDDQINPKLHGYSLACGKFKVKEDYSNEQNLEQPEYLRY